MSRKCIWPCQPSGYPVPPGPPVAPTRRALMLAALAALPAAASVERVVALDWSLIEVALALGVVPVAAAETGGYRQWVREPALPREVADLGLRVQPNLELLRMLDPTLILTIPDRADIAPALQRIAPVLSLPIYTAEHAPYARACSIMRELGQRMGRSQQAGAAIAHSEQAITTARDRLPAEPPPVVVIRFVDARTIFIFGAGGLFADVMARLGVPNGWQGPPSRWGFTQTSVIALANVDPRSRLFIIDPSLPPDVAAMMRADPLWLALPFVRANRVGRLPPVWFFGATVAAARFATSLADALTGTGNAE